MNTGMTEKRIKTIFMLIGEAIVIWYGMGTPIPTNWTDTIKLIVALIAITYTAWKNHDFTEEACIGTGITRQMKAEKADDYIGDRFYADEDEVSDFVEDDEEVEEWEEDEEVGGSGE